MTAEQRWSENIWGSFSFGSSSGGFGDDFLLKNLTHGDFVAGHSHDALWEPRCTWGTGF